MRRYPLITLPNNPPRVPGPQGPARKCPGQLALFAVLLLLPLIGGWKCATTPERIKVPEIVKVPVPTLVELDPKLTADCMDEAAKSQLVEEGLRLAAVRKEYLSECTSRLRQIRALQPKSTP